jgi:hypothetical protein
MAASQTLWSLIEECSVAEMERAGEISLASLSRNGKTRVLLLGTLHLIQILGSAGQGCEALGQTGTNQNLNICLHY